MSERPQGASGDAAGDETRPITPPDQHTPEHASTRAGEPSAAYAAPMPPATAAYGAPSDPATTRTRLRDRLWGLRALIAVALASVIVGGLAGAALADVSNHDGGRDRFGPGFGRQGGFQPGGRGFGPGGTFQQPGQQPGQQGQGQPGQQTTPTPASPSS